MTALDQPVLTRIGNLNEAFNPFFVVTMGGGTSLAQLTPPARAFVSADRQDYVTIRMEVIYQYERTILELRQELLHYKRLLSRPLRHEDHVEVYGSESYSALDAASTALVNSILTARIPPSATFTDFEEGEL
jgi:hypothetical protein